MRHISKKLMILGIGIFVLHSDKTTAAVNEIQILMDAVSVIANGNLPNYSEMSLEDLLDAQTKLNKIQDPVAAILDLANTFNLKIDTKQISSGFERLKTYLETETNKRLNVMGSKTMPVQQPPQQPIQKPQQQPQLQPKIDPRSLRLSVQQLQKLIAFTKQSVKLGRQFNFEEPSVAELKEIYALAQEANKDNRTMQYIGQELGSDLNSVTVSLRSLIRQLPAQIKQKEDMEAKQQEMQKKGPKRWGS